MKYWFIRVFDPARNKGEVDKLVLAMNYSELDDLLDLIRSIQSKIITCGYKIVITMKEFDFGE